MRMPLSAIEATKLLERGFARLKPAECISCKVPVPFWGPGVVTGSGYWYLKMIPPCPHRCERVITQLWADITSEYEIERTANEIGQARNRGAPRTTDGAPKRGQSRKPRVK